MLTKPVAMLQGVNQHCAVLTKTHVILQDVNQNFGDLKEEPKPKVKTILQHCWDWERWWKKLQFIWSFVMATLHLVSNFESRTTQLGSPITQRDSPIAKPESPSTQLDSPNTKLESKSWKQNGE